MKHTKRLVLTGLMTALVFLLTFTVKVPIPFTSGYIHLGDSMIFLAVLALGPVYGAFAAGVGSMLADLISGYAQYALPTLIIKSLMALLMGLVLSGKSKKQTWIASGTVLLVWAGFLLALQAGLVQAMRLYGDKVARIVLPEGSPEELAAAEKMSTNLPVYLLLGFVGVVLIIALAAWFISKKNEKSQLTFRALIGMVAGGMCMIIGYWLTEAYIMGYGTLAATFTLPMNLIQFAGGILVAALLAPSIQKAKIAIQLE